MLGLMRHVEAVRNVTLPGGRLAFCLGGDAVGGGSAIGDALGGGAADSGSASVGSAGVGTPGHRAVGWVEPHKAALLVRHGCVRVGDGVVLPDAAALAGLARALADAGVFTWRGEAFDVRAEPGGTVLAMIDRGALPWFGIMAEGVHVNGLVLRPDGVHLWVARRAADRLMDPGKLDHLFAGGIAAGFTAAQTLVKEGAEEAGLPAEIAGRAEHAGMVAYDMARPEGLRRDRLHCYDLVLSEAVRPVPNDGEVAGFDLWPVGQVIQVLRDTDDFKFNVGLVLLDMLLRRGLLPERDPETAALRAALRQPVAQPG